MKKIKEINLVITHKCNLHCIYCYEVNKGLGEMSIDLAKSIITRNLSAKTCDELAINLFGGEPMLRFSFIKELCEWTWQQKWPQEYVFYADTNGVNLNDDIKTWASINKKRFIMLLSLDGTPETQNFNRSNSFNMIDLDFFIKNWKEQGVKMTISDSHLETMAEDIIFLHSKGFKIKGSNIAEGFIIDDFDKKYEIIKEQFCVLIDWYLAHPDISVAQIFDLDLSICESHKKERIKYCGCGSDAIKVIDIDGKEYPCTYFFPLSMSPMELEKTKDFDFSNDNIFIDEECLENCYIYPICKGCYGDNYSTTGKLSKRSSQRCQLSRLRAFSVAKLQAHKILSKKHQKITEEERDTIIAIQNIYNLFEYTEKPIAVH